MSETSKGRNAMRLSAFRAPSLSKPWQNLTVVILVLAFTAAISITMHLHWLYVSVFGVMMIWYAMASRALALKQADAPDSSVVAEQIVVAGVASLILHVALAGISLRESWQISNQFSADAVWVAADSFAEGLICAAVAPVIAIWTRSLGAIRLSRSIEMSNFPAVALHNRTSDIAFEADTTRELRALAEQALSQYLKSVQKLVAATDGLTNDVARASGHAVAVAQSFAADFGSQSVAITAGLAGLAAGINQRNVDLAQAIDDLHSSVRQRGAAIDEALQGTLGSIRQSSKTIQEELDGVARSVSGAGQPLVSSFTELSLELKEGAKAVSAVLVDVTRELSQALQPISKSAASLGSRLALLEERLSQASNEANGFAQQIGAATSLTGESVRNLNSEIDNFSKKLQDGGMLLQGLQDLIHSVNRFIKVESSTAPMPEGRAGE